jgi:uncharacterized membrane protein YtjA (UPF0391 family)
MLKWAIIFAIISLLAGWLGFGRVSGAAASIAKVLFAIFLVLFLLALLVMVGLIKAF